MRVQGHKRTSGRLAGALSLFVLGWAMACNSVLEGLQHLALGDLSLPTLPELRTFALGTLVISFFLILLLSVTGRLWLSAALLLALSWVVGVANAEKLEWRYEPLYPGDLAFARDGGALVEMAGWSPVWACAALVTASIGTVVLLSRLARTAFPDHHRRLQRRWSPRAFVCRFLAGLLSALVIVHLGNFDTPGSATRWLYTRAGASWDAQSQAQNYLRNGFIGGSLANWHARAMDRPSDYSRQTMQALLAKYTAAASRLNRHRDPSALDHLNVVVILSESFGGTNHVLGAAPDFDPIPFTHELLTRTTSGRMLAQDYGGGTANMEFEALTGLSMSQLLPSMTYPYSMLVAHRHHFPSAVELFQAHGHASVAIHPYKASFYSRDRVYPALGFDRFVSASHLHERSRLSPRGYISDESAFTEVADQIAEHPEPMFVNVVTMQNHPDYDHVYPNPIGYTGLSGRAAMEAGNYARGLAHTDAAVRTLLERLDRSGEPTAVVFFGDHQPGFWPAHVWRSSGYRGMHQTPFWIWSNVRQQPAVQRPTTSPIYFLPTLLDQVDAPLPPFYALLEQLRSYVSAMDGGLMIDAADQETTEAALPPAAEALLHDYRLVEYDVTDGQGYVAEDLFKTPQTP